jgi:hypothetical protein
MNLDFYTTEYIKDFADELSPNTRELVSQSFIKDLLYKKFPNSNLIMAKPDEFAEILTQKIGSKNYLGGIRTDISGLIVPISKHDLKDISYIALNMGGEFGKAANKIFSDFDKRSYEFSTNEDFERARDKEVEKFLFYILKIDTIILGEHLPGYKGTPLPSSPPLSYHQTINVAQTMYSIWLDAIRQDLNKRR